MQIHHGLSSFIPFSQPSIVTNGTFDGVHLGHQKILQRLQQLKSQLPDSQSVVITFFPHPRMILTPEFELKLLDTMEEKAAKLAALGIDHLLIIPFSKAFAKTTSAQYIQQILIEKLNTKKLVIGYDHRFGKNREGSFEYLKANQAKYPFDIEEILRQDVEEVGVSSTKIRKAVVAGQVAVAQKYMGTHYQLSGKVVKGNQLGRTLGYPTANLKVSEGYKLIPADGIYAVRVKVKNQFFKGMLSIGVRPTLGAELARTIEVNIFDFDASIYGENLTLFFVKFIRKEEKYPNLESLQAQLAQDKKMSLEILAK